MLVEAAAELSRFARHLRRGAPANLRPPLDLLAEQAALAPALLLHPAVSSWYFYAETSPSLLAQVHGLAAGIPPLLGLDYEAQATLDGDGHLHLYALKAFLDGGRKAAGKKVKLSFRDGHLTAKLAGADAAHFSRELLLEGMVSPTPGLQAPGVAGAGALRLRWNPAVTLRIEAAFCGPLLTAPVEKPSGPKEHGMARFDESQAARFVAVLRAAAELTGKVCPDLGRLVAAHVRAIVPLERKDSKRHVSSTYAQVRGVIYLCHDDDPLLQAETLVHEGSHNEINELLAAKPLFVPGHDEAAYFSPWRPDPRPMRGILLGAHAFLGVARLYAQAARAEKGARRDFLQSEAARRFLQSSQALDVVDAHGKLTPEGAAVCRELRRGLESVREALPSPPGGIWGAATEPVADHLKRFGGEPFGLHKEARVPQA